MKVWCYLQDAHLIPLGHNGVHVGVAHKKGHNTVRNDKGQLHQHPAVVAHNIGVIAHVKLGAEWHLV